MASWSDLACVIVIEEPPGLLRRRVRRELARVGLFRLLDVFAMRLYYRLTSAAQDRSWQAETLTRLTSTYPAPSSPPKVVRVASPNSAEAQQALEEARPTLVLALCKNILAERIFSIPSHGTFVLHPGICPEYRNAHGCFWALASNDLENVGATLLRIDRGIDTGPVFAYFRSPYDEVGESHITIQHRMVLDNLPAIQEKFLAIAGGDNHTISTAGRESGEWGQPWLTRYLSWKSNARRRKNARSDA